MGMKTFIYGASDDLVEIEGQIREEFNVYDCENAKIGMSDGSVLEITYAEDGEWKLRVAVKGTNKITIIPAVGDDKEHEGELSSYTSYSDIAIIEGEVKWVLMGENLAK